MIDRTIAPQFNVVEEVRLLQPEHEVLQNGVDLFVFNSGEQDLVKIEWVFQNLNTEDLHLPLLNIALAGMFLEGTKQYASAEIAEKVDFYGAFLQPEYSFDHTSLTLYALNKHVEKLLPIVKSVLTESIFPESELNTYVRNNKQNLSVSLKKNDFVARRVFNKTIFDSNRYAYSPEIEDYDRLERSDILKLYQHQINAGNCTIFISGRVTNQVHQTVRKIFGDQWDARPLDQTQQRMVDKGSQKGNFILIERPDALQSAIRVGYQTINRKHPDFSSLQLLNTILGGYFGSRLMSNIREEKGFTYGIGSGIASLKYGAFFTIATEVGVEVTNATLVEIEKEIDRLRNEPIPIEELNLVKNYVNGAFLGSLENVFSHVDKFKNVHFVGLDLTYYNRHLQIVKSSTPETIMNTANKYLDYNNMIKVVVGKMVG
ncbi:MULTISPECIES: M16 family metallopeptidase [Olivibacter]|jgi:predicted Zn-dependent peptidase|uniref:M16 family metallopeptidase n=1 Tax=Olivibacter oleidegradans TaxID=760123 RepID=A0ABV6HLB8_9SPHI|nr:MULTISPECIES: pitrilysin family protein [Olivibacter]MDM8175416.1 pitrilysin family protein [Olivibacter sp. 47]MDX3914029.1 pitrilysin family protein [Pseudosphingobacterium sp.]QEL02174.1 insulinase family protein [Olivibacter sp. LS-1]